MDICCPVTKHQRHYGCLNVGDNVDRISKLPDEVLTQILSYLSTKAAVATSILSKRWEYLWALTPDLDCSDQFQFDYRNRNDFIIKFKSFKNYVDRVIFYHGSSIIRKCHLHCSTLDVSPNIYSWVCAVVTCNVQELTIQSAFRVHELPWRLFTCKSLVVLKIEGMFVLELPTYICLPLLKILSLDDVIYVDDSSMERLFSSCPVLEDLAIIRRKWDGVRMMNISIPTLKRLFIQSDVYGLDYECETEINAPCLEFLEVRDITSHDYSVNFSSSLVEAHVSDKCAFGLLNGISQVMHLVLTGDVMWDLNIIIRDYALPTFSNLKKMELYVGTPVNWEVLPDLLESSPNLEVLVFPEGLVVPKESGRDFYRFYWHQPESVPDCLLLHLKTIEIFNFVGLPGELYLLQYLLECGEVLEKMIIHGYDYSARPRMQKKMQGVRDDVLMFQRSSSACELVFTI